MNEVDMFFALNTFEYYGNHESKTLYELFVVEPISIQVFCKVF